MVNRLLLQRRKVKKEQIERVISSANTGDTIWVRPDQFEEVRALVQLYKKSVFVIKRDA